MIVHSLANIHHHSIVVQYTNYYDHTYVPEDDSVIWSLDYEKYSDFDDVAGHWHLEDHPTKPVRFVSWAVRFVLLVASYTTHSDTLSSSTLAGLHSSVLRMRH